MSGGGCSITLPFEFNGSEFRHGKIKFEAPSTSAVKGVDFEVQSEFVLLLLRGDREAWGLLEQVAAAPFKLNFKTELLGKAASEGVDKICVELQSYIKNAPNGKPRLYRENSESFDIHLTDGVACLGSMRRRTLNSRLQRFP